MKKLLAVITLLLLIPSGYAFAQGIIIPDERVPDRRLPVPTVKSQSVEVEIKDGVAVTKVDQVFHNGYSRDIEGTYIFPLPPGATVSDFAMWIGDQRVKGELLDRDQAAQIYHDIVRRMKDPALLELVGYDLFKAHVFPIPANGDKRIQLSYNQTLTITGGLANYTYPLKGRGEAYSKPIQSFSVSVKISSSIPITSIYSPTHKVEVVDKGEREATVGLESKDFVPETDFQLYYTLSDKEFGLSFAAYREAGVEEGYFMMMVAPRTGLERRQVASKDVVFVLDTSGSMMDDDKIGQAVRALKFGIRSLNSGDRFGLITFATDVRPFRDNLLPADKENLDAALAHLEKVGATGATDIYDAIRLAMKMVGEGERPRYIVFLTDGLPTAVERDPAVIIKKTEEWAPKGVRVFTFGLGFDVNTHLLDKLSGNHGGVGEYIKPKEDMELKLSQFFEKITFPVLTDLELKIEGLKAVDIYPRRLPDLFRGSQLVIFGRFSGSGAGKAALSGNIGDKAQTFDYTIDTREAQGGEFIAQLWATRKVGFLLDEIRLHGESKELKDEVIALAKKFGLVTPYTSYLVTEPHADIPGVVQPAPQERLRDQEQAAVTVAAPKAESGADAVGYSRRLSEMKSEETADLDQTLPVRRVADKTFNFKDGYWVDSEFEEDMQTVEVLFDSDEYYDLLTKDKRMSKWLALGDKLIVVLDKTAYKIVPEE
jgi:Mg-chelatase subunit ChlD